MDQPQQLPKSFSKLQLPPINKQSQVSLIEMVLLIVIIVLFYWFIISPKKTELSGLETKLASLQTDQKKIDGQKQDLINGINQMKSDPESIAKLNEGLPFDGKVMSLNLIIAKFIEDAGVVKENVNFSSPGEAIASGNKELLVNPFAPKRVVKKIVGSVSVQGTLGQLQSFLDKIEESGRLFDITDLQLSASSEGTLHLSATLNTYYYAP